MIVRLDLRPVKVVVVIWIVQKMMFVELLKEVQYFVFVRNLLMGNEKEE